VTWARRSEVVSLIIVRSQIENLIRRLRTKIKSNANMTILLITIRGLGYKLPGKTDME
jgi:DNA-binding response OmpR family regulator